MEKRQFEKISLYFTLGITFTLAALLLYQYFNGGIPSHYFLARKDMPLISNAWGVLTVPTFTWFLLWRVSKRIFRQSDTIQFPKNVCIALSLSLVFGFALGLAIQVGFTAFSTNTPTILLILALLFPTYRAEYFLGFVLGLTYFVGGVLPIVIGVVFLLLSLLVHLYVRTFLLWLFNLIVKSRRT